MKPAIQALEEFLAGQKVDLAAWPITETFERVDVSKVPLVDVARALASARAVVEQGGTVALTFAFEDESAILHSVGPDAWRLDGNAEVFSPELARTEQRGRWSTHELERFAPPLLDGATCDLGLAKERWSRPLADASGRSVWVGVSMAAFVGWMSRSTWEGAARALFARQGAMVLLNDWPHAPVTAGERLTLGALDAQGDPAPDDRQWPEPVDPWTVRAIEVEVDAEAKKFPEGDLKRGVAGMASAAAAWLLAEERDGRELRPSRAGATRWSIPADPRAGHTGIPVVDLARWVTKDSNATRLAVARHVAAERIPDPLDDTVASPVVSVAEIAYQSAVSAHVQSALRTQLDLERSFQDVDGKVSDVRDGIRNAVDQAVVRALTASLAIAVASLTVSTVRGWPTVLAAAAIAAYLLFTAWWILRTMETDMASRFDALQDIIEQRQLGLGSEVGATIGIWKNGLRGRLRRVQFGLTAFALAITIGGALLGAILHRSTSPASTNPMSPASETPIVSSTQTP